MIKEKKRKNTHRKTLPDGAGKQAKRSEAVLTANIRSSWRWFEKLST